MGWKFKNKKKKGGPSSNNNNVAQHQSYLDSGDKNKLYYKEGLEKLQIIISEMCIIFIQVLTSTQPTKCYGSSSKERKNNDDIGWCKKKMMIIIDKQSCSTS